MYLKKRRRRNKELQTDSMREQLVTQAILALQGSLYRLAFSYVHDPDEAMDLVQECAYRALKNRARLRDETGVKPWLFKILVNLALDQIKRGRREAPMAELPEQRVLDSHEGMELRDLLSVLDDKSRTVLILHYFEDMPLPAVAKILGENLNTVKSRERRALQALRQQAEERMV